MAVFVCGTYKTYTLYLRNIRTKEAEEKSKKIKSSTGGIIYENKLIKDDKIQLAPLFVCLTCASSF